MARPGIICMPCLIVALLRSAQFEQKHKLAWAERSKASLIVEAVTGIFCRTSVGLNMHVSSSIFGRRIDLKWFREV